MAKFLPKVKLPDKPSDLILLAINDLKAVEQSEKYVIDMSTFHDPDYAVNGKCAVCFAGSVMAKSLKCVPTKAYDPARFDDKTMKQLYALDSFRQGDIASGFDYLGIHLPDLVRSEIEVQDYDDDRELFKEQLTKLAKDLKALGY